MEEYQEWYLLSLIPSQQQELFVVIKKSFPEMQFLSGDSHFQWHLLRVGYTKLFLQNFPIPTSTQSKSILSGEDIFVPSEVLLRPVAIWNTAYRVVFPKNIQNKTLEPYDIISPENHAIVINGSYGVYDNERCAELTIDGKLTGRFLMLSHGDYVEIPTMLHSKPQNNTEDMVFTSSFTFPKAIVDSRGMRLCSQVARELGESVWKNFSRGISALHSLSLYGKNMPRFSKFDAIPSEYTVADVFMKSTKNPEFGHRAFAFRKDNSWYFADPYSHKEVVPLEQYRRKNDIISILVFR